MQGPNGGGEIASLNVVSECVASLADAGCVLPSWFELVDGVRPPVPEDIGDPFQPRQGWQHFASNTVEELHLREALPALPPPQRALVRSQGGPLSSRPFVCCPTSRLTKFSSQSFRVLLLRRLHLPLPLSSRNCRQGCWGGVGSPSRAPSPGFAGREAHACQRTCSCGIWISERSITSMAVVWRSWQMGCHCLVGPSWPSTQLWFQPCVGTAPQGKAQANRNGVAIRSAHRRKERTYPQLAGAGGRARLVILAGEVGGRWSPETANFLQALAVAKARDVSNIFQASVAWFRRWSNILSARAFADSLLEVRGAGGAGGDAPSSHDVVWILPIFSSLPVGGESKSTRKRDPLHPPSSPLTLPSSSPPTHTTTITTTTLRVHFGSCCHFSLLHCVRQGEL